MQDSQNGPRWFANMTETLVALLLASAAGGSIWAVSEIRAAAITLDGEIASVSVKIDSMSERQGRLEDRIDLLLERVQALEARMQRQERGGDRTNRRREDDA